MSLPAHRGRSLGGTRILRGAIALAAITLLFAGPQLIAEASSLRVATPPSPGLGAAASFSILAGSQVTNAGTTSISGNVGIWPGIGPAPHFTGFGPGANNVVFVPPSMVHDANATAQAAQAAQAALFTSATGLNQTCDTTYAGAFKELAGEVLVPGVYCATSFRLTAGALTLVGASTDTWIFKSASDLIISGGAAARVVFTGDVLACNVWWRVVSTATLDAGSSLVGNILADTSITFAAGARLDGRALARTAEVTLSSNVISGPSCTPATATPTATATATAAPTASLTATPGNTPTTEPSGNAPQEEVTATSVPATSVPAATRTATALPTATATATRVPATATLPAATSVPAPIAAIVVAPVVVAEIPIPPLTPIVVVAIPEGVELVPGELVLPAGTVIDVPEIGLVVIEAPVPVEIPVLVPVVVPVAPQPQVAQTPTPRPTAPAVSFPNTGTGPAPVLLPTTGMPGGSTAGLTGALALAGGALALAGSSWARRRRGSVG